MFPVATFPDRNGQAVGDDDQPLKFSHGVEEENRLSMAPSRETFPETAAGSLTGAPRQTGRLPHALECVEALRKVSHPAFFLDFDGTLTPIVAHPDDAILSPQTRAVVRALAEKYPVGVVSGRDVPDLRARVDLEGIAYAGSHGFDVALPGTVGEARPDLEGLDEILERTETTLRRELLYIEGVVLERKRFSLAVHYRLVAPSEVPAVLEVVQGILAGAPRLRPGPGKMVVELLPNIDCNKGDAVDFLLETLTRDRPEVQPVYLGDDLTDEHALRAIEERGHGIVVWNEESRPTFARYRLRNPDEVRQFLQHWL